MQLSLGLTHRSMGLCFFLLPQSFDTPPESSMSKVCQKYPGSPLATSSILFHPSGPYLLPGS